MKRMLNWFRLRKLENELDRELKYHMDRRVSDLIHSGLPEPEARRRAALELGGATQVREVSAHGTCPDKNWVRLWWTLSFLGMRSPQEGGTK